VRQLPANLHQMPAMKPIIHRASVARYTATVPAKSCVAAKIPKTWKK
jgi:hypothetical protein